MRGVLLTRSVLRHPTACNRTGGHLLCVDVHAGQPAAKAWVAVVPPDHHLWPVRTGMRLRHPMGRYGRTMHLLAPGAGPPTGRTA